MSEAMSKLDGMVGGALTKVIPLYQQLADIALQTEVILGEVMKEIFDFFGVYDKNVIGVDVVTTKVIQDKNMYKNMITRATLSHQKAPDTSIISNWVASTKQMETSYRGVQAYGEKVYYKGLPSTSVKTAYIPTSAIEPTISTDVGQTVVCTEAVSLAPTKDAWVQYSLQGSHGYKPGYNTLTLNGLGYHIDYVEYNYTTALYDVRCYTVEEVTTKTTTTTTVTVTAIDATTDNENTTITERTEITGTLSGYYSDVTVTLSNVNIVVATGASTNSTNSVVVNVVDPVGTSPAVITVPTFVPVTHIVAKYYVTASADWYWWIYELGTNVYPAVENAPSVSGQMKFMSIVPIRTNKVSITSDKTSTAYKDTKALLKLLAMNVDDVVAGIEQSPDIASVQDVFVQMSVNLNDSTEVIDKLVYTTFSELYEHSGLITSDGVRGYAAINEAPYNLSLTWAGMYKNVVNGSIGAVGTYQKTTNTVRTEDQFDNTGVLVGTTTYTQLVLRKQTTPGYYVEYIMEDLVATTMIDALAADGNGGVLTSTKIQGIASGIEIPLAFFVVNQLNTKELADLFPDVLKISIYAASTAVIPWYQTKEFGVALQIIAVIVTIVVTIFTVGFGSGIGVLLEAIIEALIVNFVIGAIVGIVLQALLKMVDDPYLKALLVTIAVVIIAYFGGAGLDSVFSANTVTLLVTNYANIAADAFDKKRMDLKNEYGKLEDRVKTFENKVQTYQNSLSEMSTEYVAWLQSVDAQMYVAKGEIMYNRQVMYDTPKRTYGIFNDTFKLGII